MKLIKFSPEARDEILAALRWWSLNRDKAPHRLRQDLRRALRILAVSPGVGAAAPEAPPESGIRFLYLRGSRYLLYYSVNAEQVEVLRFWQASQVKRPFRP
jgi:plasmid stabilization system protein ParE